MTTDHSITAIVIAHIGFCSSMTFGTIQIVLTHFVSQNVFGTYKLLITLFAAFGMMFSMAEVVVHPNVHVINNGAIFFVWCKCGTFEMSHSWFYAFTISFLAVMFIYRYWAVFCQQNMKFFQGPYIFIWISYCAFFGFFYSSAIYFCLYFDDVSFTYFKDEFPLRYGIPLKEIPAMAVVAFDPVDQTVRWRNVFCIINIFIVLGIQYTIMMACGWKMHREMEQKIKHFSPSLRKHHKQFFKTLVIQITAPSVTLFAPLIFIICLPLFDIKLDMSVGALICSCTLYPAIDAMIVMYVVSDYRKVAIRLWKLCCKKLKKLLTTPGDAPELTSKRISKYTQVTN